MLEGRVLDGSLWWIMKSLRTIREVGVKWTVSQLLESVVEGLAGQAGNPVKDSNSEDSESIVCCLSFQRSWAFKRIQGEKLSRNASEELGRHPSLPQAVLIGVWVKGQPQARGRQGKPASAGARSWRECPGRR